MDRVVVPGRAYPQGSKRHVGGGRLVEQAGANLKNYRATIGTYARRIRRDPTRGPVAVSVVFTFARPKKHYQANGALRDTAPTYAYPCKRGDIDKLLRAVLDALTGVWIVDDVQVVSLGSCVSFGDYDSTEIALVEIDEASR